MRIREWIDDIGYVAGKIFWRRDTAGLVPGWVFLMVGVGLIALFFDGVIWALAAFASGLLLGFVFAIPGVKQDVGRTEEPTSDIGSDEGLDLSSTRSPTDYQQTVNTNLVEISNWLTKMIVGIGLFQLSRIPEYFESLARFLAGSKYDPGFVGSVLVFFAVVGFLAGYLITRLFLARAFSEADQNAAKVNQIAATLPQATGSRALDQPDAAAQMSLIHQLTNGSPRLAILGAFEEVYSAARELLQKKNPSQRLPNLASSVLDELVRQNLINEDQANTYRKLRQMRNLAAHSMALGITETAANDFVNSALGLIHHFKSRMES